MWKQRDSGVGTSCTLSPGISRSDRIKKGQSVYGPSLAPMEEKVDVPGIFGGTETVQVTALGRSKAAHEFLVLHYFGLDSAKHWDALMSEVLPAVQLPGASARRATALEMYGASHITCEAPHTRYLTKPWTPRNLRRRYERCSRKQQKLKHSFTRKSSATLSVLFTQPTKQSVVLAMFCRPIGCFRFLETEKSRGKQISFQGQKLQLMQHPKDSEIKVMTSNLH